MGYLLTSSCCQLQFLDHPWIVFDHSPGCQANGSLRPTDTAQCPGHMAPDKRLVVVKRTQQDRDSLVVAPVAQSNRHITQQATPFGPFDR